MNLVQSQEYEAKRKQIAKGGPATKKTTGALAPFTAQLLEHDKMTAAYKQEYDVGRAYAKKQFSKPMSIGIQSGVLRKLGEKIGRAKEQDPALRELGDYISFKTNTTWIQGPIKVVGGTLVTDRGAYNKTVTDYFLDWTANKDLIRGTCAARTAGDLISIVARIQIICSPEFGMTLMKRAEMKLEDPKNACGYSGWNFVVVMKGSAAPAEIQANTWAMMYGKMSKTDYTNAFLGGVAAEYERTEREMGFEGALGHLFYEIWQKDKEGPDGIAAAALSTKYCDMCRKAESERAAEAIRITVLIGAFGATLKTPRAQKIWATRTTH